MSRQQDYDKLDILGVDIDAVSTTDAISYITELAKTPHSPATYVVKPYVEFIDRAYRHDDIRELLNDAELAIADGVALMWAAAFLYAGHRSLFRFWFTLFQIVLAPAKLNWPIPDRAAGVNFTWPLLEQVSAQGLRVFLIGKESPSEISATAKIIMDRLPNIKIVGTLSGLDPQSSRGQVGEAWLDRTRATIATGKPDIVLVGMGFPLQEQVCAELAARLPHGVFIGEGGTFDYESFGGPRRKAPRWLQRIGLEWLWRLLLEPSRIRRQLAIPRYIYRIWKSR